MLKRNNAKIEQEKSLTLLTSLLGRASDLCANGNSGQRFQARSKSLVEILDDGGDIALNGLLVCSSLEWSTETSSDLCTG